MGTVAHGDYSLIQQHANRIAEVVPYDGVIHTFGSWVLGPSPTKPYAFYNMENLSLEKKRRPDYLKIMDEAEVVFDYSEANAEFYPRAQFCPVRLHDVGTPSDSWDKDFLFLGTMSTRRKRLLDGLGVRIHDVAYEGDSALVGDELRAALRTSRYVLSVGFCDNPMNDSFRVFPFLEMGARMIVEQTCEPWFNRTVAPFCHVVETRTFADVCLALLDQS